MLNTNNVPAVPQTAAFENLQAAIVRLAVKRDMRLDGARHELRDNVERALEAYREYMRGETLPGNAG